jgi:hypothetical protein
MDRNRNAQPCKGLVLLKLSLNGGQGRHKRAHPLDLLPPLRGQAGVFDDTHKTSSFLICLGANDKNIENYIHRLHYILSQNQEEYYLFLFPLTE